MKKFAFPLLAVVLIALFGVSCSKEIPTTDPPLVTSTKSLKVSDGFTWSTSKKVEAEIGVAFQTASGLLSKIEIFKSDPSTGGKPIASGSAGYAFNFITSLMIPSYTEGLWVSATTPDGVVTIVYQPITGSSIKYNFQPTQKSSDLKNSFSGPDCTTGCNQTISGSGSVTVKNGQTYCITTSFTGTINFEHWNGGGTVRICGTANPQNLNNMGNNCHIVVADGGSLTINSFSMDGTSTLTAWQTATVNISSLNMNQATTRLINYSDNFTINSGFSPSGKVDNYGILDINGTYNSNNSSGYLSNSGTLNITGDLSMNNNLTNSGAINISGNFNLNTSSTFINTCKIIAQQNGALNNGVFTMNGGFLQIGNTCQINASGQLILQNQSMVSSVNLILNNSISGAGSTNTIKTTGTATINSSKTVSGAIEWADNDAVLTNGSVALFINGATFTTIANATNYIPTSACNPAGQGTPPISDTDGDGVADPEDEYPTDPLRAYNNYYPSESTFASMAFEDLWPYYGDFDMNDLVVDIRFNRVTNAQNNVVDLINTYQVKAVGGSFKNGFAFQLDQVSIGSIASVTGTVLSNGSYLSLGANGLENGTDKPVIFVYDDAERVIHRAGGSFFNTENNGLTGTSDLVTITVNFATPQPVATIGLPPYNHFIVKNKVREQEIHLPNQIPTSKADPTLFGTGNDDSNPGAGKYYKSATNLPWAIFIAESFDYPVEKADISTAHLKFAAWAQSSGTQYPNWYLDEPGFRNPANIYGN